MIGIKGMEMPSDCAECPFCNHLKPNDYGSYGDCAILGDKERMNLLLHEKHFDCPLTEIITCSGCVYGIFGECKKFHHHTMKDDFCNFGKRKE